MNRPPSVNVRTALLVAALFGLLVLAVALAGYLWWTLAEVPIGVHGLIALVLGATVSLALGGGLMALVFYSSRHGHDERARRPWD